MKRIFFFMFLVCFLTHAGTTKAQILKRIKSEVSNRAANKVANKAGDAVDKAIDNAIDGPDKTNAGNNTDVAKSESANSKTNSAQAGTSSAPMSGYKSYDFVPGDKIIFEPDLSKEADAELPARYKILAGNAEIQSFEGEKILHLGKGGTVAVAPLMNSEAYLPEQFTIEFDMMYENEQKNFSYANTFDVQFLEPDGNFRNQPLYQMRIVSNDAGEFGGTGHIRFTQEVADALRTNNKWNHIAIYIRGPIGKAYINEHRVLATNTLPKGAGFFLLKSDGRYGFKIKNLRLAAGGDDKYNKIVTDGKFITYGILFDVNKANIKPQSMGALNEIVKLMKEHGDLKFEIQGHTDSDGNQESNVKLSQERADAVKNKLVEMGIEESRLSTKGFGSAKPIDKNDSAEGKANNRRVEFVKV